MGTWDCVDVLAPMQDLTIEKVSTDTKLGYVKRRSRKERSTMMFMTITHTFTSYVCRERERTKGEKTPKENRPWLTKGRSEKDGWRECKEERNNLERLSERAREWQICFGVCSLDRHSR